MTEGGKKGTKKWFHGKKFVSAQNSA